jgi:hypothetical protein
MKPDIAATALQPLQPLRGCNVCAAAMPGYAPIANSAEAAHR